ncbi:unnamed protein product [Gongylonema pulchrum]|uniref:Similar to n=1 Tax=Gongylonema pulchrum TaxID=637853 RepID=A0A183CWV1_9BILA|nr:unnamed protein product [Gongylonema pulchrum]
MSFLPSSFSQLSDEYLEQLTLSTPAPETFNLYELVEQISPRQLAEAWVGDSAAAEEPQSSVPPVDDEEQVLSATTNVPDTRDRHKHVEQISPTKLAEDWANEYLAAAGEKQSSAQLVGKEYGFPVSVVAPRTSNLHEQVGQISPTQLAEDWANEYLAAAAAEEQSSARPASSERGFPVSMTAPRTSSLYEHVEQVYPAQLAKDWADEYVATTQKAQTSGLPVGNEKWIKWAEEFSNLDLGNDDKDEVNMEEAGNTEIWYAIFAFETMLLMIWIQ